MFTPDTQAQRSREAGRLVASLADEGTRFVQTEMPDINGTLRGKITTLKKGLSPSGSGVSTALMLFRSAEEFTFGPISNVDNGFPKMVAVPDYSTVARLPWQGDMASVLCDLYMDDGSPCSMDGRQILQRVVAQFAALGLEPRAALEWEFYAFEADEAAMREGRFRELRPFGLGLECYSITRFPSFEGLAKEFMTRMAAVGTDVECFHTEYGKGMYEFTCEHEPAVKAADDGLRAKTYLRQLCYERGIVPTFMASLADGATHSGCHHNLSLWRDGHNACWDEGTAALSPLGRHFLAGMLATMPEFHVLFRPWVNSYRRLDRWSWNPEDASWGIDRHDVAVRVVHGALPEKYTRFEHRVPGPDVNPYLALAAMLWGGLRGIQEHLDPPEPAAGDPLEAGRYAMLPRSLPESVEAFRNSANARELFGDAFVDHYVALKTDEHDAFSAWAKDHDTEQADSAVTDWEYEHYFTWV
jgi:glutamine synthetase